MCRLGANFHKILVNCPLRAKVLAYNRDGVPPVDDNYGDIPNYYPNTFNGPIPYNDPNRVELIEIHQEYTDNLDQAREIYLNYMTPGERSRAIENIMASLGKANPRLRRKAVKLYTIIHPDLGSRIRERLEGAKKYVVVKSQTYEATYEAVNIL